MDTRLLVVVGCLLLFACSEPNSTAPPVLCHSDLFANEPTAPECPFPRPCATSDDCPLGTACLKCPGDGTCDEVAAERPDCPPQTFEEGDTVCLLPASGSIGLVDGFEVTEFLLKRKLSESALAGGEPTEEDLSAVFEFQAPGASRFVHCALFACPPEVVPTGDDEYVIANFDRCVLANAIFGGPAGFFDLTRADYGYPQQEDGQMCAERPVVTSLQVGCWAYAKTKVIGASLLLPISPEDEIFDYTAGLRVIEPGSQECAMEPCRSAELTIGGSCRSACEPRCVSGRDCPVEYEQNCVHMACPDCDDTYSYVGVCQEPEPIP
jgi:hypothetical protein